MTRAVNTALAGSGGVLQVVQQSITSTVSTTSSSYVATGLIASITPSSTASRILVMLSGGTADYGGGTANMAVSIYRSIAGGAYSSVSLIERMNLGTPTWALPHSACYLDSPASTSVISYQPYFLSNANTVLFNNSYLVPVVLTLLEIAG